MPSSTVSRWWFLRLLGVSYLIAFLSLGPQLIGLVGHEGIVPVEQLLQAARLRLGPERYALLPTVCWLSASDPFLRGVCAAGALLSSLLIVDVAPSLVLGGLWVLYLSLVSVCRDFLAFQWDNLLLEAGFLAIFLAPLRLRPRSTGDAPPSPVVVWLLWWLLFRLMVSSGVVKLASGDPSWRHLTALTFHYETQPLPTWIGWYVHQWPVWWQQASCLAMFAVELLVPFLIIGPRRLRRMACAMLVAFQLLIAATGNYGFFNLLAVALCVLLLDDAAFPRRWRERLAPREAAGGVERQWPAWILAPLAGAILLVSAVELSGIVGLQRAWPSPVRTLAAWAQPFRTVNGYGLFAVMTTSRQEIVIEGSADGTRWLAYEFRWKPGEVARRPAFVAPHQPRLDWQMWFAALGTYREQPWFLPFCERLLEGSPAVLSLLARNPFPATPPRYLRALVYDYRFTTADARRAEGAWWRRTRNGLYCPILSLRQE